MQIEQIDRDAAVSLIRVAQLAGITEYLDEIEDGSYDENFFVQAFARHRLAAQLPVTDVDVAKIIHDIIENDDDSGGGAYMRAAKAIRKAIAALGE